MTIRTGDHDNFLKQAPSAPVTETKVVVGKNCSESSGGDNRENRCGNFLVDDCLGVGCFMEEVVALVISGRAEAMDGWTLMMSSIYQEDTIFICRSLPPLLLISIVFL